MLPDHHNVVRSEQPQPFDQGTAQKEIVHSACHAKNLHLSALQSSILHATDSGMSPRPQTSQHPNQPSNLRAENLRFRVSKNPIKIREQRQLYMFAILPSPRTCNERHRLRYVNWRLVGRLHHCLTVNSRTHLSRRQLTIAINRNY